MVPAWVGCSLDVCKSSRLHDTESDFKACRADFEKANDEHTKWQPSAGTDTPGNVHELRLTLILSNASLETSAIVNVHSEYPLRPLRALNTGCGFV
jgi:hypothetical protein